MAENTKIGDAIPRVLNLLKLDKKDVYNIYLLSILGGIVALSLPLGIQSIIGFVMAATLSTSIIVLITLVLIGTFLNGFLQIKQLEFIEKIEQKLFVRFSLEFGSRIPKLNIEKLDTEYLPELVNRFFDISTLQKSIRKLLIDIPGAIIQIILGTLLLSFYHPLFIAFGFMLIIIVVLILRLTSNQGFKSALETSNYKYQLVSWFEEMARSVKTFKFGRNSNINLEKTDYFTSNYIVSRTKHFRVLKTQYWSLVSFKVLITAAMLILGVFLLINQQINIGQFIAADIVIITIISSIEKLIFNMDQVYDSLTAVEKLNKVASAEIEKGGSVYPAKNSEPLEIEFENVNYKYSENENVFQNLNFKLEKGQWLLLKGDSGKGKSTILRLITGTFVNFTGKILINKLPIRNYNIDWLRSQMGILLGSQDLFNSTLKQNITLGNPDIEIEEIMKIANCVGLIDFISSNPKGFDTVIDPLGKRLPTIVKNQILICRALVVKSGLFVLEHPFNGFDKQIISNITDYLKNTGATVIITDTDEKVKYDKVLNLNDL
jgi:ABC-type bacteriocin/lantibiotic exporter with double-glycine peptidase domain